MKTQRSEIKARFAGPSGAPKTSKTRGRTVASKREMAARKAHEDVREARRLADEYDMPCSISEFT